MSLLLDLSRFRGTADHIDRRFDPDVLGKSSEEDFQVVAPVELSAEVRKDARKVRLVGHLATTLECGCSRCLEPFAVPVDTKLDILFLPSTDNAGGQEDEVGEEDLGVSFYKDDQIDLG